jgi:hypothetical protein
MPPDDAEKRLGEWHEPVQLSVRKSRAERVSLPGQTLRGIAVVHAEIAGHAEPIVDAESDRAAGAVHPDGIALKNIKGRIFHRDVGCGSVLSV